MSSDCPVVAVSGEKKEWRKKAVDAVLPLTSPTAWTKVPGEKGLKTTPGPVLNPFLSVGDDQVDTYLSASFYPW
jgi:hypothetical protein